MSVAQVGHRLTPALSSLWPTAACLRNQGLFFVSSVYRSHCVLPVMEKAQRSQSRSWLQFPANINRQGKSTRRPAVLTMEKQIRKCMILACLGFSKTKKGPHPLKWHGWCVFQDESGVEWKDIPSPLKSQSVLSY